MALATPKEITLRSLIQGIPYAMLTTYGVDGSLHGRPMIAQDDDGDDFLWFFSDNTTHKVTEIAAHSAVNVSYSDQRAQTFVSVSGDVEIISDPTVLRERWRPSYAKWIPLAIGDRKLVLMKVVIRHIAYWSPPVGWIGRTLNTSNTSTKKSPT